MRGVAVDGETRCIHYHSRTDIIAIKARCCGEYYACKDCHEAIAGHPLDPWPRNEWGEKGVLCGACAAELTINEYLACGYQCPRCGAAFNPGCRNHHDYYFAPIVMLRE